LLPASQHLIATHITTPIITPLSLAMNLALFGTCPYGIWQIWRFVAPALYPIERKKLSLLLTTSLALFGLGCLFCYVFILPCMFQCMIQAVPKEVLLLPDIGSVTNFTTEMFIIFGCSFQIPLLCLLLIHMNILSIEQCRSIRPYAIVAAFIIGMILTPPDVMAQILLALPLWGLYEAGILLSYVLSKSIR
jgi:sec-independent protein translocase protein TatC